MKKLIDEKAANVLPDGTYKIQIDGSKESKVLQHEGTSAVIAEWAGEQSQNGTLGISPLIGKGLADMLSSQQIRIDILHGIEIRGVLSLYLQFLQQIYSIHVFGELRKLKTTHIYLRITMLRTLI